MAESGGAQMRAPSSARKDAFECMPKLQRVRVGDLLCIPLAEGLCAVGVVLHISKRFAKSMMVAYYDKVFPSCEEVDVSRLDDKLVDVPNYTGIPYDVPGEWSVIGNYPDLAARVNIPVLRVVNHTYYKDDQLGTISMEELEKYPPLLGQGKTSVENRLRKHFGREADQSTNGGG